jgi:hypothetical protein
MATVVSRRIAAIIAARISTSPERVEPVDRLDALTVGHLDVDHGGLQVGMPQQGSRGAECAVWSLRRRW